MRADTKRKRIVEAAAVIVHVKGYSQTGIDEVAREAGIPKGSFYFYFKSKRELGFALIDYYTNVIRSLSSTYLKNPTVPPIARLDQFFRSMAAMFKDYGYRGGDPLATLISEVDTADEQFRDKILDGMNYVRDEIRKNLEEAVETGDLPDDCQTSLMADFVFSAWQGTIMRMKLQKASEPFEAFHKILFEKVLPLEKTDTSHW